MPISMLKYIKIHKNTPDMFRSQQIIIREYVCASLKLLNYLRNTEFKILKIIPGVVAAKRVAGTPGDPCGAVH
jgi:hypothetical protein